MNLNQREIGYNVFGFARIDVVPFDLRKVIREDLTAKTALVIGEFD
jgi:hypothetical protein